MFFSHGFPFGDMGDMGGFQRGPRKEVDTTKYYSLLGIEKEAPISEIKKAYRKLAIKHHPDKGGDPEVFKEVSRAYEVLSDPEKRRLYDEHGEEGLDGSGATEPTDIFDLFFGGGSRRRPEGKRRGEDIESSIKVTLEQIYNGATRRMAISKDVICEDCSGAGGPPEAIETCGACNGTGLRVQIKRMGPMIQQTQSPCTCRNGRVIAENKKCRKCSGVGTCKERRMLEVYIDKGVENGHKVVFSGEADEKPDTTPGDVKFIVDQQPHTVFTRKGCHLLVRKQISLYEALTGYKFVLKHLDNRQLLIQSEPNEITDHGTVKMVPREGMPIHKSPFEHGNLLIEISIKMPDAGELLLEGQNLKNALRKVFPLPPAIKTDADMEVHTLVNAKADDMRNQKYTRNEAYNEDDEDGGAGGHRVQCRQQ